MRAIESSSHSPWLDRHHVTVWVLIPLTSYWASVACKDVVSARCCCVNRPPETLSTSSASSLFASRSTVIPRDTPLRAVPPSPFFPASLSDRLKAVVLVRMLLMQLSWRRHHLPIKSTVNRLSFGDGGELIAESLSSLLDCVHNCHSVPSSHFIPT